MCERKTLIFAIYRSRVPIVAFKMTPFNQKVHTLVDQVKKCSTHIELESIYASMLKTSQNQDCFFVNQFISACSSIYHSSLSLFAFTQIHEPNVFVYNATIRGFVHCNHPIQALLFYTHMLRTQVVPTSYTFSSLVKACSLISVMSCGEVVHLQVMKHGFDSHLHVQTCLIDLYSKLGDVVSSRKVFDEMSQRDVFSWTTMVSAYARAGDLSSARRMFEGMPEKNTATWNTVIDGYARSGDVESVEALFKQMPVRDIISWTTMINCYSQNKRFTEALAVFNEMKRDDVTPDQVTMATFISVCAHLGGLRLGKEIHLYVMQNGFDLDVYIGSALIDMYAKCGSIDRSLLVFFKLREKNLFCWNSVIEGLAAHGYGDEALAMFKKMEKDKIQPNGVTFISILTACTHAGLVEEGRKIFHSMSLDYGISREVEHYGCIVDLLSKAGKLTEALDLVRSMEFKPNSVIWGALLSGCKLHMNLEIARVAIDQLTVLEPYNSGYYTLLINMKAEDNRWREVAEIRTTMKELGIEKTCPGSSWIELEGGIHQFAASGKSHKASGEIYSFLTELDMQLKLAGCMPGSAEYSTVPGGVGWILG